MATVAPQEGPEAAAHSIGELYDEIERALADAFPRGRELWVVGEIQKITEAASGHAYIDVVDAEDKGERNAPVLKAKCWKQTWGPLKARLRREGVGLEAGMTIVVRGSVGFYRARAEIDFTIADINSDALLGRLARERQALIDALVAEGLFDAQRQLSPVMVPLRVGLVGSPGTEGFRDFLGQLEASELSFSVTVVPTAVQGQGAAAAIARAIGALDDHDVDVICLVRGGGSKADLAVFDAPMVARAIATCSTPVHTGIGHTGDEAVADLVAHERHITPTACGAALAARVGTYWNEILDAARLVSTAAIELVESETLAHQEMRATLVARARGCLREHDRTLHYAKSRLQVAPSSLLSRSAESLAQRASRLVPSISASLATRSAELEGRQRLLGAYDPARTLARGWSLTTDEQGRILRSVGEVSKGAMITTRMFDGELRSTVIEGAHAGDDGGEGT
jgi:exodeoxyribonuclease VII large subunit